MNVFATLDGSGRVLIPKGLRDKLSLEPGDTVELQSEDGRLTLRPVRPKSPLRQEQGVWVFRSGKKISAAATDKMLRDMRRRRGRENQVGRS